MPSNVFDGKNTALSLKDGILSGDVCQDGELLLLGVGDLWGGIGGSLPLAPSGNVDRSCGVLVL